MDYANTTNVEFIVDPKVLFHGWLIYSYLQIFKLIKWLPGECTDWFFDNIMTWSYCLHRRYRMSGRKTAFWEMSMCWTVNLSLKICFSQLVLFLAHVQGEPIGLSAGVLSVINKSFFLTVSLINYCIYFALHFFALYVLTNINLSPSKQKFLIKLSL